jgi:pyruvate kinase
MDVARVSFSHGSTEESLERIERIRSAVPGIGVLADLPGPKVRATPFGPDGADLVDGRTLVLVPAASAPMSSAACIGVTLDDGLASLSTGELVVIGDGGIALRVRDPGSDEVRVEVITGGHVQGRPGITLPNHALNVATPTVEDLRRIEALSAAEVEAIAVSFVRSADDIEAVRRAIGPKPCMLVAKIETEEAVENIDSIVQVADVVMVARGDLGVRLPLEDVPSLQKKIIRAGIRFARPVVTATQMLESMIHARVPTRAEVSDVANSVLDGTSAVMLSGETAIGRHPVGVIEAMARIVTRAERDFDYLHWGANLGVQEVSGDRASALRVTAAITGAGWRAALEEDAAAIIACSSTGATVRSISRFRPSMPIVAVVKSAYRARQLQMSWGVTRVLVHPSEDSYVQTYAAIDLLLAEHLVRDGDVVVVLAGSRDTPTPITDTVRIVRVADRH